MEKAIEAFYDSLSEPQQCRILRATSLPV